MKILAIELSTVRGSVAWCDADDEFLRDWPNDRQNSGAFFRYLRDTRTKFGLPDIVIVGLGPGSYAGTRIAISAAIGLAASGAKLIGYPSVCAMECDQNEYCVVGDARRQSFFFARVAAHELIEGPDLFSESDLKSKLRKLDSEMPTFASEQLPQIGKLDLRYPSAVILARLAAEENRQFVQPALERIYLREPHITVAKPI